MLRFIKGNKVVKVFTKRHRARHKVIPSKWRHENPLLYGLYFASNVKCQCCLDIFFYFLLSYFHLFLHF